MDKSLKEYSTIEIFEELETRRNEYGHFTSVCRDCGKKLYRQLKPSDDAICKSCLYERIF